MFGKMSNILDVPFTELVVHGPAFPGTLILASCSYFATTAAAPPASPLGRLRFAGLRRAWLRGDGLSGIADAAAEDAGAVAVDDADAGQAGEEGAVKIFSSSSVASSTVRPMRLISMRMSSVLALVTVTWTFFCLRAAASGSAAWLRPAGSAVCGLRKSRRA